MAANTMGIARIAQSCVQSTSDAGFDLIAKVRDGQRAIDVAIMGSGKRLYVIRCVGRSSPEDHAALETMVLQGPFLWGGLVYRDGGPSTDRTGVESFHETELHQLIARLQELQETLQ